MSSSQVTDCVGGFTQRVCPVDDWPHLAASDASLAREDEGPRFDWRPPGPPIRCRSVGVAGSTPGQVRDRCRWIANGRSTGVAGPTGDGPAFQVRHDPWSDQDSDRRSGRMGAGSSRVGVEGDPDPESGALPLGHSPASEPISCLSDASLSVKSLSVTTGPAEHQVAPRGTRRCSGLGWRADDLRAVPGGDPRQLHHIRRPGRHRRDGPRHRGLTHLAEQGLMLAVARRDEEQQRGLR